MKFLNIPAWLFFPFKLVLMATFLVPVFLWGGQMLGFSKAQETALAMKELQRAEKFTTKAEKYLEKEASTLESQAAPELERLKKKGDDLLAVVEQEITDKTKVPLADTADPMEPVRGIDVSHYQGLVNWERVVASGIHFGYVKATGGMHFVDPRFHENWHGMRATQVHRGAYHFFYAAEDPRAQAKHFIATVRKLRQKDLPPVLDVEISDHTKPQQVVKGTLIWLETVEKALGKRPIVYTDPSFGKHYLNDPRFSKYPLWIAEYAKRVHSLPPPWRKKSWTFWQHSQKGSVEGVAGAVDLNLFNGTIKDLEKFVSRSAKR